MTDPDQDELNARMNGVSERETEYVPPDATIIKDYAHELCQQLGERNVTYNNPEIESGFASFLTFIAERMAKYLNTEHREYLLQSHKKPLAAKV